MGTESPKLIRVKVDVQGLGLGLRYRSTLARRARDDRSVIIVSHETGEVGLGRVSRRQSGVEYTIKMAETHESSKSASDSESSTFFFLGRAEALKTGAAFVVLAMEDEKSMRYQDPCIDRGRHAGETLTTWSVHRVIRLRFDFLGRPLGHWL